MAYRSRNHYTVFLTHEYAVFGSAITSFAFQGIDFSKLFIPSVAFWMMNKFYG
jgi:hypothetical protein